MARKQMIAPAAPRFNSRHQAPSVQYVNSDPPRWPDSAELGILSLKRCGAGFDIEREVVELT